ncbi:unnamed protein product [Brassica oleracea]
MLSSNALSLYTSYSLSLSLSLHLFVFVISSLVKERVYHCKWKLFTCQHQFRDLTPSWILDCSSEAQLISIQAAENLVIW